MPPAASLADHVPVLHVRIASPPDVTGRLLAALAAESGVLNLVVLMGAARHPDGDAVQFDLRTSAANPVFRQLRDLRLVFGVAIRWSGHLPQAFLLGVRPVASLIDDPNLFSVIVAVLAGLVGVISLTESRVNALIGVFISVTTIPAAAALGLSLAMTDWSRALGSALQLLLNVVLLIAVGAAALRVQRLIWRPRGPSG